MVDVSIVGDGLVNFKSKIDNYAQNFRNKSSMLNSIAEKFKKYVSEYYSMYGLSSNLEFSTTINGNSVTITLNGAKFVFIEFGTGVVGTSKPNTHANEIGYRYNAKQRISKNPKTKFTGDYWGFYNESGEFIVTRGMPSRPFFSLAINKLDEILLELVKNNFKLGV